MEAEIRKQKSESEIQKQKSALIVYSNDIPAQL